MSGTKATIRADSRMRSAVAGEPRSHDHSLVLLDSVVIQQHYLYTIRSEGTFSSQGSLPCYTRLLASQVF